jgi:hypothetical protein
MRHISAVKLSITAASVVAVGLLASPLGVIAIWTFPR